MTAKRKKIEKVKKMATMSKQKFTAEELAFIKKHNIQPENKIAVFYDLKPDDEEMIEQLKPKMPEDMIFIIFEDARKETENK